MFKMFFLCASVCLALFAAVFFSGQMLESKSSSPENSVAKSVSNFSGAGKQVESKAFDATTISDDQLPVPGKKLKKILIESSSAKELDSESLEDRAQSSLANTDEILNQYDLDIPDISSVESKQYTDAKSRIDAIRKAIQSN